MLINAFRCCFSWRELIFHGIRSLIAAPGSTFHICHLIIVNKVSRNNNTYNQRKGARARVKAHVFFFKKWLHLDCGQTLLCDRNKLKCLKNRFFCRKVSWLSFSGLRRWVGGTPAWISIRANTIVTSFIESRCATTIDVLRWWQVTWIHTQTT